MDFQSLNKIKLRLSLHALRVPIGTHKGRPSRFRSGDCFSNPLTEENHALKGKILR